MSLYWGEKVHSREWEELPIEKFMIERVEHTATEQRELVINIGYTIFEWLPELNIYKDNKEQGEQEKDIE